MEVVAKLLNNEHSKSPVVSGAFLFLLAGYSGVA
jgi:hypothetical protein